MKKEDGVLHDAYGSYISSPPVPPVPPFPCVVNNLCTANNRICDQHRSVLFVKNHATGETFEIPFGKWENWEWYKQHISDLKGIPIEEIRLVYAGAQRDGLGRHSGLCRESTIHLVLRPSKHNTSADKKT
ncbi:unnamed protein product [Rotaria sp. Silwood2]|nr:unnamed protein product [Rotaria sp. Silwood2]CAF3032077.1 unnamed protein product [Rotaria sp. Silwood2]CAF3287172.1 unnamed protein product [Rotaria sp. Silwood2]CAF3439994.1 unnamed protein product [Rotaria sp. Silwood2]CAF4175417.1 unnamed protein product [Rotaria sp. Silwood2]